MTRSRNGDSGYAIAMVSLLLIPLIGFMALAIDVGAWYTQATRVQRATDAAALSGTIWMPDIDRARIVATESLAKNGIDLSEMAASPSRPRWELSIEADSTNPFALLVRLTDTAAPVYFSAPFLDNVEITRQALAEFVAPVRLGSPANVFGNDLPDGCRDPTDAGCETPGVTQPGFWPLMAGKSTNGSYGDAHGTDCSLSNAHCDNANFGNPDYRASGYLYAIDVPPSAVGQVIEIQGYDLSFNTASGPKLDGGNRPFPTEVTLYDADGSLLTTPTLTVHPSSAEPADPCSEVVQPGDYPQLTWTTHCSFIPTKSDIYPFRMATSGFPGANENGIVWNYYSLKAVNVGSGDQPKLFALNDMAMKTTKGSSRFHLAEITSRHEGDLLIRLWDAGDAHATQRLTLRVDTPWGFADICSYRSYSRNSTPSAWQDSGTVGDASDNCAIVTSEPTPSPDHRLFDNKWLEVRIPIPPGNACDALPGGCWWYVDYLVYNPNGNNVVDVTTWEASVVGDPVRLTQ